MYNYIARLYALLYRNNLYLPMKKAPIKKIRHIMNHHSDTQHNNTPLDETSFITITQALMEHWMDDLEKQDVAAILDLDIADGSLYIGEGRIGPQWLLSRHIASRELWLSSPLSGGLHFRYQQGAWHLPDGRTLGAVIVSELQQETGHIFTLPEAI